MELHIKDDEIEATFEPFVTERFSPNDPQWVELVRENARLLRRRRLTRHLFGWLPWVRRTQKSVAYNYSRQWAEMPLEVQLSIEGPTVPCVWRGAGMRARAVATKRVHLLFLMRMIAQLKPTNILEVGCGNGLNLFILAGRFPEIRFTGLELTAGGVAAAGAVCALPELPPAVRAFAPEAVVDPKPFERITFVRGNAGLLPFRNGSYDFVFTVLALEQMEEIRMAALREIRRVARAYTAMIESFFDWNATGPQRDYILANDYFSGSVADLKRVGLTPLYTTADMPSKLTFRPALVVCGTG